jgi:CRP-like cAMP-binding protein
MDLRNLKRCAEVLKGGRWFQSLPQGFQDELLAAAVTRKLSKGEWLFARGDEQDGMYAVVDGAIRVAGTVESGKEIMLMIIEPPLWFGEIAVFDGQRRTHDAIAEEDTLLVHVPAAALDAIFEREPRFWRALGVLVAAKLRVALAMIEDTASLPIAVRLARRLVMSAERYGEWHGQSSKVLELRQEQLATMLSVSRQTVNQLLKELEGRGLLRIAYGNIEILDLDGLRQACALGAPR